MSKFKSVFKAFDNIKADDELKIKLLNLKNKKNTNMIKIIGGIASVSAIFIFIILFQTIFNKDDSNIISDNSTNTTNITNSTSLNTTDLNTTSKNLPKIAFEFSPDGMGFGGLILKDVEEAYGDNPLLGKDDEIKELPVFENPNYINEPTSFDVDSLREKTQRAIDAFELSPSTSEEIYDYSSYGQSSSIYTQGDGYTIGTSDNGSTRIDFINSIPHPEDLEFDNSPEKYEELIKYYNDIYKEKIKSFTGLYYDGISIFWDYSYEGDPIFYSHLYTIKNSLQDQAIAYSFNTLSFWLDSYGNLSGISIEETSPNEENKIGDYPIISKEEAISQFKEGNFASTVSPNDEELLEGKVEGVELKYYNPSRVKNFIPVYKLYVTFENGLENYYKEDNIPDGFKTYVAFYVPAISPQYLDGIKLEIQFN